MLDKKYWKICPKVTAFWNLARDYQVWYLRILAHTDVFSSSAAQVWSVLWHKQVTAFRTANTEVLQLASLSTSHVRLNIRFGLLLFPLVAFWLTLNLFSSPFQCFVCLLVLFFSRIIRFLRVRSKILVCLWNRSFHTIVRAKALRKGLAIKTRSGSFTN